MYIDNCSSECDQRVISDSNLSIDNHIEKSVVKANQTLGLIKRTFTFLNKSVLFSLYKALVRPLLECDNVTWYPLLKRQSATKKSYKTGKINLPLSL